MMEQRRQAVVVLGMHRSGTSAMSRVLSLAGAQLPSTLSGPYVGNPLGHWEPLDVADFNDRVLANLDSSWSDPLGPRQNRARKLPLQRYISGAQEVIKNNYNSDLIVFKEPRTVLLLDLWRDALNSEGYETSYVIMVRHPMEVANSLSARDKFIKNKSMMLWSTYMAASEEGTRGSKRVFVKFDDLLQDSEAALDRIETTLGIEFPRRSWESALEIEQFLSREERHHWDGDRAAGLETFPEVAEFYSFLDAAARDEPWNIDVPTRMAEWLNGLARSVGPIFKQLERQLKEKEAELSAERETAGEVQRTHEQTLAELADLRAELERQLKEKEAELSAERETAGEVQRTHEQTLAELVDLRAELERQLKEKEVELAAEREAVGQAQMESGNAWRHAAELEAGLAAANVQIEEKERDLDQRIADLRRAREQISEVERRSGEFQAQAADHEREFQRKLEETLAEVEVFQRQSEALASELIKAIGSRRYTPWWRFRVR